MDSMSTDKNSHTRSDLAAYPSDPDFTLGEYDLSERAALRRVAGLSTELTDITEVEYRQLRLERVVLVGVWTTGTLRDAENSLKELARLAETAGSEVLEGLIQRRDRPDPATYIGSGKAKELRDVVLSTGADTVICDGELAPGQLRQLEEVVKVKVVDRTALILDIFAQHARSREGKAQVELAQLQYLVPRLRGWGESLSRQVGGQAAGGVGIGGRGPGETKLEIDRRRISSRMAKLRREIAGMKTARDTKRARRDRNQVPSVVLAGYTNAGKSSLLNRLTDAGVLVENALFATLDPTVRRSEAEDGREFTLTDTVGFVRHLPHQLIEAFRSTLEEVADADLHATERSLGVDGITRYRLLDECTLIGLTHAGVAVDLAGNHGTDQQDAECRRDRQLGPDPQILDDPCHCTCPTFKVHSRRERNHPAFTSDRTKLQFRVACLVNAGP